MELLIVILVLVAVAVAAGVVIARRRSPQRPPTVQRSPAAEQRAINGDVRRLAPGDVVSYEGTDFLVDRSMHFEQDGFGWDEHFLADAISGRKLWLSVEDDDGLEVAVYERVTGADLDPSNREITHDGVTYRRDEQGRARFSTRDADGAGDSGTMEYADYTAGDARLSLERYGESSWEVSVGRTISEHALDIYSRR